MKIGIIGLGAYSIAIANLLIKNKSNNIIMWSESEKNVENIKKNNKLPNLFEGKPLPKGLNYTNNIKEAVIEKDIIYIVVAAKYLDQISKEISEFFNKKSIICICSKGIEQNSCLFLSEVISKYIKTNKLVVISGPSFAVDILNEEPVALSIASKNKKSIIKVKETLESHSLKLRETNDVIGIQLCGSIKNIIAIASGIISGLGYSESTRSFLITESLHDIKELIHALGGSKKTILSFAGVGDLILTSTSVKSRNFSYGMLIGQKKFEEAANYLEETTVEGYYTLKSVYKLVKKRKVKMPIIDLIYKIILNKEDPNLLINFLINKK